MILRSFRTRIIIIVWAMFVIFGSGIYWLAKHRITDLAAQYNKELYNEKLDTILHGLRHDNKQLQKTGRGKAYQSAFQGDVIDNFRDIYRNEAIRPMILDGSGRDLLWGEERPYWKCIVDRINGIGRSHFEFDDSGVWVIGRTFLFWGWHVIYMIPETAKNAHTTMLSRQLAMVIFVVSAGISILLLFTINRITRPISELIRASEAIADGDLEYPLPRVTGKDEFFVLNENFIRMQTAIRSQLQSLGKELLEHKETQHRLEESRKWLNALISNAQATMAVVNPDGKIRYEGPSLERILGYRPDELEGQSLFDHIHPDDQESAINAFSANIQESGSQKSVELRYRHKDGSWRWLESVGQNLIDDPVVHGVVINSHDITERKEKEKLEARLHQSYKMEAIGTLAGGIAHDFNNILGSIIGFAQIIEMFKLPKVQGPEYQGIKEGITEIQQASHRAQDLVQQILTFSRKQEMEKKPLMIGPIVKESLKLIRASIPASIEIKTEIEEDIDPVIADPTQIHQIVINLATNAAHAMKDHEGVLKISLEACTMDEEDSRRVGISQGRFAKLTVSDTGCGIPDEIKAKIFDPYFTTKKIGEGTGLGLSVVHGIVRDHQGGITVSDRSGGGTTFNVYLPLTRAAVDIVETTEQESPVPKGEGTILFVDDEASLVAVAETTLSEFGYSVVPQTSVMQALSVFFKQPDMYDLVITDLTMPQMSGIDLAREVQQVRPDLPVILCTGNNREVDQEIICQVGIKKVLVKPIPPKELARIAEFYISKTT